MCVCLCACVCVCVLADLSAEKSEFVHEYICSCTRGERMCLCEGV